MSAAIYPDGAALLTAYLTGGATLPGLPIEQGDYLSKAASLGAIALDGIMSAPPGPGEPDEATARDVPAALTVQQVGLQEDAEAGMVDFTLLVTAYGAGGDEANALLGAALATFRPGGEPLDGALVGTSKGDWYCHWCLQRGGGADTQDDEPRWPYSQATIVARFNLEPLA